jgi:hypothetical protein
MSREHSKRETRSTDKVKKTNAELRDSLSNIKDTQGDLTAKVRISSPLARFIEATFAHVRSWKHAEELMTPWPT